MKHVVLEKPGQLAFGTSPDPEGGADIAIVRVHQVGVCGTDIHAFHGRQPFFEYPRILGHELGVEVVEAPAGSAIRPGIRCSVEPYLHNPMSAASQRGKTNCCEDLQVLGVHIDGGLRPYLALPVDKLHPSETLGYDQLALVETLCIGAHAVRRAAIQPDDRVAVIGAGPIGLGVLTFAQGKSRQPITVLDVSPQRLSYVRDHLGIEQTICVPEVDDLPGALRDLQAGELPTILFDATGSARSMNGTFELIGHGGTIVFVGLFQGDVQFHDPLFHRKELTLKSSRNATAADFRQVMAAMERGDVDTKRWLTHEMAFEAVPEEFAQVIAAPNLLKATISMGGVEAHSLP